MLRSSLLFSLLLLLAAPRLMQAQVPDWSPPSSEMPMMPTSAELRGDWLGPRTAWFRGVGEVSGTEVSSLRASAQPAAANGRVQIARFSNGPVPVVVWSDRNADGRSDMIEIFRSGGVIIQLIDADFDGRANVVRVYDSQGSLLRQNPL